MGTSRQFSGCMGCHVDRRRFLLTGCAACAGAAGALFAPSRHRVVRAQDKARIKIVYSLHAEKQPGPDWPNVGFDFGPVMERLTGGLSQACPEFDIVSAMATGPEEAEKILAADSSAVIDGYIVCQLNCWNRVVQTIATSEKPVLYVDFQFGGSGGFLVYTAGFLRNDTPNVAFVASSEFDDLVAAAKCFGVVKHGGTPAEFVSAVTQSRIANTPGAGDLSCLPDALRVISTEDCLARIRESKILAVRDQESGDEPPIFGIPVVKVPFAELNDAWAAADKDEVAAIADGWQRGARAVVDIPREVLETSAAMYIGEKVVMKKHDANAITINCLGGFYGNHIHAYPCLGLHELNNQGLVGGCECDVRSAATMVAFGALTQGRPGYISDPVMDTAKRQIIYAHCVASNRAFGPDGDANPFDIMTHSEDRQGASVRSILPLGYMTTTLQVDTDKKEILFHQAKAVANDADDRACRTKLCAEPVGDFEKLFTEWDRWGWHRVTFYGDFKEPVYALADATGYKVVEEA